MIEQNVGSAAVTLSGGRAAAGRRRTNALIGYVFIAPVVLGILIFSLYPLVASFYFSFFKKYSVLSAPQYFGLFNYTQLFRDADVGKALGITFLYAAVTIPLSLILSFLLALLLNSKIKGIGIFRVLCYLPVVIPSTVLGILYNDFFDVKFGLANQILRGLHLPESTFFSSASTSMITLIFTNLWGLGGGMILWLAALKNVPESLLEAAKIDGANAFVRLLRVTIPMCSSMIFYNLIMGIIGALQTFGNVFIITGGTAGVERSLLFYSMKIYFTAFQGWNMGYASAMAWLMFLIIAALTAVVFLTSKWVFYGEES